MSSAETAPVISCSGLLLSVLQIEASETETKSPLEKKRNGKRTPKALWKSSEREMDIKTHTHTEKEKGSV